MQIGDFVVKTNKLAEILKDVTANAMKQQLNAQTVMTNVQTLSVSISTDSKGEPLTNEILQS